MFAILEILPKDNSRFARFRERFSPPQIYLQEIKSEQHLPYYIIRSQEQGKGIAWREIEDMAGRCKSRMLIQSNISLPNDTKLAVFKPNILPSKIIFNTAEHIIKALNIEAASLNIGVIDKEARAGLIIEKLVFLCQTLSIYTLNTGKYIRISKELYEKYGISIIISDNKEALKENILTISLDKDIEIPKQRGYCLSLYRQRGRNKLSLGKVIVPDEFYLPPIEGISRFDYICALYELCLAKSLENAYCETVFYGDMELSLDSAAKLIIDSLHLQI